MFLRIETRERCPAVTSTVARTYILEQKHKKHVSFYFDKKHEKYRIKTEYVKTPKGT